MNLTGWNWKRIISVISGSLGALGVAYVGLAQIWCLPMADQIQQTIGVLVSLLSALLSVSTGFSVAQDKADSKAGDL